MSLAIDEQAGLVVAQRSLLVQAAELLEQSAREIELSYTTEAGVWSMADGGAELARADFDELHETAAALRHAARPPESEVPA